MGGKTSIENGKKGGRPKNRKNDKTLIKEMELDYIRQRVAEAKDVLISSQLSLARGVSYLYRITTYENGKRSRPVLVTSKTEIEAYLADPNSASDDDYYYITTEKPENTAIDSLLDRVVGKPKQTTELTGKDGKDLYPTGEDVVAIAAEAAKMLKTKKI